MDVSRQGVVEGMTVYSADGYKVGKVIHCSDASFEIEKGFFFPKDYLISYGDVRRVGGDDVYLLKTKAQLNDAWQQADLLGDARRPVTPQASPASSVRMPSAPIEPPASAADEELDEMGSRRRLSTDDAEIRMSERKEALNVGTLSEEDEDLFDDDGRL